MAAVTSTPDTAQTKRHWVGRAAIWVFALSLAGFLVYQFVQSTSAFEESDQLRESSVAACRTEVSKELGDTTHQFLASASQPVDGGLFIEGNVVFADATTQAWTCVLVGDETNPVTVVNLS